jgi:UDP-N-acetylglucosamine 1-carboxyvinyltransferase
MASFIIEGGHQLSGEIEPQGAKNEVLQIICAVLLTSEKVTINNIPAIRDAHKLIELLRGLNVKVSQNSISSFTFQSDNVDLKYLKTDAFRNKSQSILG